MGNIFQGVKLETVTFFYMNHLEYGIQATVLNGLITVQKSIYYARNMELVKYVKQNHVKEISIQF